MHGMSWPSQRMQHIYLHCMARTHILTPHTLTTLSSACEATLAVRAELLRDADWETAMQNFS